jgi:Tfp pilus assembly protein PilV
MNYINTAGRSKGKRVYPAPLLSKFVFSARTSFFVKTYLSDIKRQKYKSGAGFTIVEIVISIFILSIAIVGIYNAFSIMVVLNADTADRLTSAYLAQEGMEIVRNIRDNNWVKSNDWRCGLVDISNDENAGDCDYTYSLCATGCEADYTVQEAIINLWSSSSNLNIDRNGFYSYLSCPLSNPDCQTKFTRKITITPVSGYEDHIIDVSVEVFWDKKATILNIAGQGSIKAEENLYNWY